MNLKKYNNLFYQLRPSIFFFKSMQLILYKCKHPNNRTFLWSHNSLPHTTIMQGLSIPSHLHHRR